MRKIFIASFFVSLAVLQFGCGGSDSGNANNSNANTTTTIANTNSNPAVTQSTPLPVFPDADTAYAEGNKLFDENKTELAVEAYKQAVEKNPDFADAWFKLGVSYALIEKQNEIDSLNEENPEETPTPTPAKKSKKDAPVVRTKDSEKAFEKAVAAYKKILAKDKENADAYYNLGRSYNKLDEDEDAAKALKEAVKLKPEEAIYQTEYGAILIKLAQYDEAVRALKKALEIDPENSEAAELLEKAEAGKKRINFGVTPKPPTQQENNPRSKPAKPTESESPETSVPDGKTPDTKPAKTPEKKLDKKGDQ